MITTRTITVGFVDIEIHETSKELSWRLVHDGSNLVALFQSEGITSTKNTLFEAQTKDECIAEAQRLGLSGLDEWIIKDIAEQFGKAYQTDKIARETPFQYLATITVQSGITDVTLAISNTRETRLAAGKIGVGVIKTNPSKGILG